MDLPLEVIIVITGLAILVAVAWLELRYIRTRRQEKIDAAMERDDAYNAISTTKAVASSLRQAGRDTTEADVLIYQAEGAYERAEYINCIDIAKRAKTCLLNSKEKDLLTCPAPPPATKKQEKEQEVPAATVKKLPANYLESKFIIETVQCMLPSADGEKAPEAQRLLAEAQDRFAAEEYTEALRISMKAKRLLESAPAPEAPARPVEKIKPTVIVHPPQASGERCGKCGADLSPGDSFCHSCGAKKGLRVCPSCSQEAKPEDAFCRKCGASMDD